MMGLAYYISGPGPMVTIDQFHTGDKHKKEAAPRAAAFSGDSYVFNMNHSNQPAEDALSSQERLGKWIHFEEKTEPVYSASVRLKPGDPFHNDKDEARIEVWVRHSSKVRNEPRLHSPPFHISLPSTHMPLFGLAPGQT